MTMPHREPRFMVMLQEMFESSLMEILPDEDSPDGKGDLGALVRLASAIPDLADSIAESMPNCHIGASPDLLVETLLWVVGPDLLPVGEWEVGEGQDVGSGLVQ